MRTQFKSPGFVGAVAFSGLFALFAGCSSTESAPAAGPGPDASPDAPTSAGSLTVKSDTFTVPPGGDVTKCTAVRGTNATEVFTNRFRNKLAGHHVILYTVDHAIEPGTFHCGQGGQWNWSSIYGSQRLDEQYQFPAGVGFKLAPNQQFVIETHIINTTDQPIEAVSELELELVDATAVQYPAAPITIGTTNIELGPRANGRAEVTCTMPADVKVARFFGHTHRRGQELSVSRVNNGTPEAPFYKMGAWDDPVVVDSVDIKSGDTFNVGCDFKNDEDRKIGYPSEMCQAVGFYWPATEGGLVCESYGANPKCNCFNMKHDVGPGGNKVEVEVSRAETIANAKGDLSEGRPVYCYAYKAADAARIGLDAKVAYWTVTGDEAKPLASESDKVQLTFHDVSPGDYVATCAMDSVYGGYFPGTGSPIVFPVVPFTVGDADDATPLQLKLNFANP